MTDSVQSSYTIKFAVKASFMLRSYTYKQPIFKVFAYIWLDKGNQNEFLKHPKIKWFDGN